MKRIKITIDTRELRKKLDKAVKAIKEVEEYDINNAIEITE